jgi:hypothetical protein
MILEKICDKHGVLIQENIYTEKSKNKIGYSIRCRLCKLEKDRKWKENNREKHRASAATSRNKDRTHVNEWVRNDRAANPEKYRNYERVYRKRRGAADDNYRLKDKLKSYNLTVEQYKDMIEKQNNKCAICGNEETRRSRTSGKIVTLSVDHCHDSNKVRSLLCHSCNVGLGAFKDSIELLDKAIEYLKKHNKNQSQDDELIKENQKSFVDGFTKENQQSIAHDVIWGGYFIPDFEMRSLFT